MVGEPFKPPFWQGFVMLICAVILGSIAGWLIGFSLAAALH